MAKVAADQQTSKIKRTRGKRLTAALVPQVITQHNCVEAVGVSTRVFLAEARRMRHTRMGQLVMVELDTWLDAIRSRAVEPDDATEETTIDDVRAALGVARR